MKAKQSFVLGSVVVLAFHAFQSLRDEFPSLAHAGASSQRAPASVELEARLDREEISLDDSVTLQISVQFDAGGGGLQEEPTFDAPDFDIVNRRSSSMVNSRYENGRFSVQNRMDFIYSLRPTRAGALPIRKIRAKAGGKDYAARDLSVTVVAAGAATQPPRGYGGSGVGLRGAGKRTPGVEYFLRAETDRQEVYKGQQVVVSYYLYSRVNVNQPVVTKYPIMNGFLREDLDIPVITGRLETEQVVLDGVPYARSLLARYAAYPLQEGKVRVDSMGVNLMVADAEAGNPFGRFMGEDDPFGAGGILSQMLNRGLSQFRKATARSEPISVEVLPLPADGKPESFSGAVGKFQVVAAADRVELPRGDAFTITLKIEGNGNLASVEYPKVKFPEGFELYESKSRNKIGRSGMSERLIDYVVIPRKEGEHLISPFEFNFFNPESRQYETQATQPISIRVLPGANGESSPDQPRSTLQSGIKGADNTQTVAPLKDATDILQLEVNRSFEDSEARWVGVLRGLFRMLATAILVFAIAWFYLGVRILRERARSAGSARDADLAKKRLRDSKGWDRLEKQAQLGLQGLAWNEILEFYERLCGALYDLLDRRFEISSRALSRGDLERELIDLRGMDRQIWQRIAKVLEYAEAVRFALQAGVVTESEARKKMQEWVREGREIQSALLQ
jgi:hypothetical protein